MADRENDKLRADTFLPFRSYQGKTETNRRLQARDDTCAPVPFEVKSRQERKEACLWFDARSFARLFLYIFIFAAEGLRRERTPNKARRKKRSKASDRKRGLARAQHRLIGSRHQTHHATRCYREHSASRRRDGIFAFARRTLGSASLQTTR